MSLQEAGSSNPLPCGLLLDSWHRICGFLLVEPWCGLCLPWDEECILRSQLDGVHGSVDIAEDTDGEKE